MEVLISTYAIFAWTHLLFISCTYFHLSHFIFFFFFNFTGHQIGNTMLYTYKIIPMMKFYMSVPPLLWRRVLILSKMKEGIQCFKLLLWCMTLRAYVMAVYALKVLFSSFGKPRDDISLKWMFTSQKWRHAMPKEDILCNKICKCKTLVLMWQRT